MSVFTWVSENQLFISYNINLVLLVALRNSAKSD